MRSRLGKLLVGVAAASALILTSGCVASQRGDDGGSAGGTFVYAMSSEAGSLEPTFTTDMASGLVGGQIFEGLVGLKPGGLELQPVLATSWKMSEDGKTWTFELRDGVKFHDGTAFDAAAVCANFDRWYNLPESAQSADNAYYYGYFFGGFKTGASAKNALYSSCEATGDHEAVIHLTRPSGVFLSVLALSQFVMHSPTALKKWQDDSAEKPGQTAYATEHPTGTGPFVFASWEKGKQFEFTRNDDYWGQKAGIDRLVMQVMPDDQQRVAALKNGEVNGADNVPPTAVSALEKAGFQMVSRPPLTLAFLGMNQADPLLKDIRVRQAIAHAIDRQAIIASTMPAGTEEANQWLPKMMTGWNENVTAYQHDVAKAKALLDEAGATGKTIEILYQAGGSSACLPSTEDTLNVIRTQLEAIGLKVKPLSLPKSEYSSRIYGTSDHQLELSCWIGMGDIPDSFIGLAFGFESPEFGFNDPEFFAKAQEAALIGDPEEMAATYRELNDELMKKLTGVPFASAGSTIGLAADVRGFVPSPISGEMFNTVSVK